MKLKNDELILLIAESLAKITNENADISEEQLVECMGLTTVFMMIETGIKEIESDEYSLVAKNK
jgi:hypothetical protein